MEYRNGLAAGLLLSGGLQGTTGGRTGESLQEGKKQWKEKRLDSSVLVLFSIVSFF